MKNLSKGYVQWSTRKTVLGWAIDTAQQVLALTHIQWEKLEGTLAAIPKQATRVSNNNWYQLLGILHSEDTAISGAEGMFIRLYHALKVVDSRRGILAAQVHDKLNLWRHLFNSLVERPTNLREIRTSPLMWTGATDASLT